MADTAGNSKSATPASLTQQEPEDAQQRKQCVRGPAIAEGTSEPSRAGKFSAHHSSRVIAQLNEKWRVVDDPIQWILQLKKGKLRERNSGWAARSYCRTKNGLLRCIRECVCQPDHGQRRCIWEYRGVEHIALKLIAELPDFHP